MKEMNVSGMSAKNFVIDHESKIIVKGIKKPDNCVYCPFKQTMGIINDYEDPKKNEKYIKCAILDIVFKDTNLMLVDECPVPSFCPIEEYKGEK